jgi:pimeloyl-ACP methyl ester carboxylesterase
MADDAVVPFRIEVPEEQLDDLKDRLRRTRWPEAETVTDWSQGTRLAYLQEVCAYWADGYDWRQCEARLNTWPQIHTEIDGLGFHALHVRSPQDDALPLVLTHGWPGSIIEFQKVIGPLSDPGAHGGDPADAFHVVCPTLPGFGFSGKPSEHGWKVERIADAWDTLMGRLGYERYGAQGGDWGSAVTSRLGVRHPDHVVGIHLNMVVALPTAEDMADLDERGQAALAGFQHYQDWDSGYSKEQSTRPQTVGYGLVDSPVGLAGWILEKFWAWTDCDGHPENALTRDELLDNLMLYWLPGAGASSARIYWESFNTFRSDPVDVPTGAAIFPKEIFRPPRAWAERQYRDIRQWNELDKGGHFAAFEQPETFVEEVRRFFRHVR